jgi:regulator of protease activity HflC (stomatin/prohibitin superfamily)
MADYAFLAIALGMSAVVLLLILVRMIRIVRPYEQGVVVLLGSYKRLINPGFNLVSPLAQVLRVDLRSQRLSLARISIATPHGPVVVSGSVRYRVRDAARFAFQVKDVPAELGDRTRAAVRETLGAMATIASDAVDRMVVQAVTDRVRAEAAAFGVDVESVSLEASPGGA